MKATERPPRKNPIMAIPSNIASGMASGTALVGAAGQSVSNLFTGERRPVDPYSDLMSPANRAAATGEGISTAAYKAVEPWAGETGGNIASFLTQTGLSMGQFASALPFGGTGALAILSSSAAGQTALDVTKRGGSANEALVQGTNCRLDRVCNRKETTD